MFWHFGANERLWRCRGVIDEHVADETWKCFSTTSTLVTWAGGSWDHRLPVGHHCRGAIGHHHCAIFVSPVRCLAQLMLCICVRCLGIAAQWMMVGGVALAPLDCGGGCTRWWALVVVARAVGRWVIGTMCLCAAPGPLGPVDSGGGGCDGGAPIAFAMAASCHRGCR